MSIVLLPYSRKPLRQLTSQLVDPWKFTVGEREKLCHSNPPPLTCHHPSVVQEGIRARRPGLDLKGVSEGVAVLHTAYWQSIIPTVRRG